jgi:adenylosuccinate lyase
MMDAVKRGGNRQELHERIRVHSLEAGHQVKDLGQPNNLIDLIAQDPLFGMTKEELTAHLEPSSYIGRCPEQVDEFLHEQVAPVLSRYHDLIDSTEVDLKV